MLRRRKRKLWLFTCKIRKIYLFCLKSGQNVWSHVCGVWPAQKWSHAHTSHIWFKSLFTRTRTHATAHRTCACAHAPSQPIPCLFGTWSRNGFTKKGCKGACAHAHVRCAVARVRVRAKRLLKHVCEVCARGHFWPDHTPHTCDHTFCQLFKQKREIFLTLLQNSHIFLFLKYLRSQKTKKS